METFRSWLIVECLAGVARVKLPFVFVACLVQRTKVFVKIGGMSKITAGSDECGNVLSTNCCLTSAGN